MYRKREARGGQGIDQETPVTQKCQEAGGATDDLVGVLGQKAEDAKTTNKHTEDISANKPLRKWTLEKRPRGT